MVFLATLMKVDRCDRKFRNEKHLDRIPKNFRRRSVTNRNTGVLKILLYTTFISSGSTRDLQASEKSVLLL